MEDNYIKSVDEGSPLYGRVESGDTVIAINGNQILDENGNPIPISTGGMSYGDEPMIELLSLIHI